MSRSQAVEAPPLEPTVPLSPMQQAIVDIRALRARLQVAEGRSSVPIAITGMACRFPGDADTLARFWQLLVDEVDAIGEMPGDRWDVDHWYDPDPDAPAKMSTRTGGFLKGVDTFDAEFFGISDREAISVDPQHRLLLEVAWSAFEDGGLATASLYGSKVGAFVGISSFDYANLRGQTGDLDQVDAYHATGISHSAGAGRLSYYFGLQGPAISIDTACSSSLVAIHLACQSLRLGECDAALAGGINLILAPEIHVTLSKARMLAPDGRCKAFDSSADGFVRSEGCGMLVLKRLPDAIRDGDRIHAVIRGSACNQDGRSSGLSAPNGPSQTAVIRAAWMAAGIKPEEIGYVEAHGTGTALGDPIEAGALSAALKDVPAAHELAIGSVKTNLGHMEAAAGVAGVIKTALAMQHQRLPASLHFKHGSPNINWAGSHLKVVAEATVWPRGDRPRLAGVSSFGFSGTNVHLVLQEPPIAPPIAPAPAARVFAISALTGTALIEVARQLADTLRKLASGQEAWADFARSINARRSHFPMRAAWVARTADQALTNLEAVVSGEARLSLSRGRADAMRPPIIGFMTGDTSGHLIDPYADELYATSPVFRAAVDACGLTGDAHGRAATDCRTFAVQYGLAHTWRSWSGEPVLLRGNGVGAWVAACVAGMLPPLEACRLVALRAAYCEAGDSAVVATLAAYRKTLAETDFDEPSLASAGGDAKYWLDEAATTRTGADLPLQFGMAGDAILLDLTPNAGDSPNSLSCASQSSLRTGMLEVVAKLYARGAAINWQLVEEPRPGRAADLPGYPWSRRRYWFLENQTAGQPLEDWSDICAAIGKQADMIPVDMHLHRYAEKYAALAKVSIAYIINTLDELGAVAAPDAALSAETLVSHFGVQPLYHQLMDIWLNMLADERYIQRTTSDFATIGRLVPEPITALVEDAEAVFSEEPILLDYIRGCGTVLTLVIRGELSPLETLFPNGSMVLAERIYHGAALSRYFNAVAAAAAHAVAAKQPKQIRVLEIGGGTGGVTGSILAALPAERTRYTFTDISAYFFEAAIKRFAQHGFIDFAVLDIERDPASQGFPLGGYDLIVAANVLHATTDLGQTLDFVASLLVPGGALLLYEVTHPPAYFNISIALIEGWQLSADDIRDIGPLIDTNKWLNLLPKHGFDLVEAWPKTTSPAEVLGSHVFLARAVGASTGVRDTAALVPNDTFTRAAVTVQPPDEVLARLADAPEGEHRRVLVDFVRGRVSAVLRRPEGSEIPADRPLMDLGLDSLMALELRNSLDKALGLADKLPATLIFDYPSIDDIAGLLLERLNHSGDRAVPAVPVPLPVVANRPAEAAYLTAGEVDELSDAEVERVLNERLGSLAGDKP